MTELVLGSAECRGRKVLVWRRRANSAASVNVCRERQRRRPTLDSTVVCSVCVCACVRPCLRRRKKLAQPEAPGPSGRFKPVDLVSFCDWKLILDCPIHNFRLSSMTFIQWFWSNLGKRWPSCLPHQPVVTNVYLIYDILSFLCSFLKVWNIIFFHRHQKINKCWPRWHWLFFPPWPI